MEYKHTCRNVLNSLCRPHPAAITAFSPLQHRIKSVSLHMECIIFPLAFPLAPVPCLSLHISQDRNKY